MKNFKFTLIYSVPVNTVKTIDLLAKLEHAGCDEVFGGVEDKEKVSIGFTSTASSISQAIGLARSEVSVAVPNAKFKQMSF